MRSAEVTNAEHRGAGLRLWPTAQYRWFPLAIAVAVTTAVLLFSSSGLWLLLAVLALLSGIRFAFFTSVLVEDDRIHIGKPFGTTEIHASDLKAVVSDESPMLTIFGWNWEPHVLRTYRHDPEVLERFATAANRRLVAGEFEVQTPEVLDLALHLGRKKDQRLRSLTLRRVLPALALAPCTLLATWWIRDNLLPTGHGALVFHLLSLSLVLFHLPWLQLLRSGLNRVQREGHWNRYADELDAAILQRTARPTETAKAA